MTHPHLKHAQRVVNTFKSKLEASELAAIDQQHFAELELLIESAISTSVLYEVEHAAEEISQVVEKLRKKVEHL